jgi:hypothetical protein
VSVIAHPVSDHATLRISVHQIDNLVYQLTDLNGRVVESKKLSLRAGINAIPINLERLPRGVYSLSVSGDQMEEYIPLIKK